MRFSTVAITAAAAAGVAVALPFEKRTTEYSINDTLILQYALTLEHLENSFYHEALSKYDAQAFADSGFPDWVRCRIEQIASHEASHVEILSTVLGNDSVTPCTYKFPYTDPKSFVALATIVENVGTSAYLGAAAHITDKSYVTVAGSILTTEARHQSWLSSSVQGNEPWSSAYDTPLDFSDVFSIAAAFITSCPDSNAPLPFKAFPTLALNSTGDPSDQKISLIYGDAQQTTEGSCLILYSGLTALALPIESDSSVQFPKGLQGISYAVVASTCNTTLVDDSNTIAGPAIIDVPFTAYVENPVFTGM